MIVVSAAQVTNLQSLLRTIVSGCLQIDLPDEDEEEQPAAAKVIPFCTATYCRMSNYLVDCRMTSRLSRIGVNPRKIPIVNSLIMAELRRLPHCHCISGYRSFPGILDLRLYPPQSISPRSITSNLIIRRRINARSIPANAPNQCHQGDRYSNL